MKNSIYDDEQLSEAKITEFRSDINNNFNNKMCASLEKYQQRDGHRWNLALSQFVFFFLMFKFFFFTMIEKTQKSNKFCGVKTVKTYFIFLSDSLHAAAAEENDVSL